MTAARVKSFPDFYDELRRPFTAAATKFKIQRTWEANNFGPAGGQAVAYVDARLVAGRLNAVCPGLWSSDIQPHPSGKGAICSLTIGGVTRTDYGQHDFENAKADFSDAFKRAAVHFGIGESLYVLPRMKLTEGEQLKRGGKGNKLGITYKGTAFCRNLYQSWLDEVGVDLYGKPFDLGDVEPDEPDDQTANELLGNLIEAEGYNADQLNTIRTWIRNGKGLDPVKADQAIHLLQAKAPETLLERAEEGTEKAGTNGAKAGVS